MVSAAALLRVKRERDTLLWVLTLILAVGLNKPNRPERAQRVEGPKRKDFFDYKMRQAGERDDK